MTIKIEKGLPVPTKQGKSKYPIKDMTAGDSFFAPDVTITGIWAAISRHQKTHGGDFTARTVTENGVKGVRVWRVK